MLPEKYAVAPVGQAQKNIVGQYANKIYKCKGYEDHGASHYHFPLADSYICSGHSLQPGYILISFEEFSSNILTQIPIKQDYPIY